MNTYIALLRGINVGGHHKLPMRDLVRLLEAQGLRDVRTYIQSGNVVFRSDMDEPAALAQGITAAIEAGHGFAPGVIVLRREELEAVAAANPYPEAEGEPKSLHLFFRDQAPDGAELAALEAVRAERERLAVVDRVLYLHTPDGIGRSKLAERLTRSKQGTSTARNWRTVSKLLELAAE